MIEITTKQKRFNKGKNIIHQSQFRPKAPENIALVREEKETKSKNFSIEKAFLFLEMTYLPQKECHPSVNSSLNLFNVENVDASVKHCCSFSQQPLSENIHFHIYSSEDYFIDLTSTFKDFHVTVKNLTI